MRKGWWRALQALVGAMVLFFIGRDIVVNWARVRATAVTWDIHWNLVLGSLAVTWTMYAILIWGWRTVLVGWGQWLGLLDAARIWTISSLGKYIPGKIWAIAGMVIMSEREGVSGAAATGSAIVMQLVSVACGSILAVVLLSGGHLNQVRGGSTGALALAGIALVGVAGLTSSAVAGWIGRVVGRPGTVQPVAPLALVAAILANFAAWAGYGLSFQLLAFGTMPGLHLSWADATGAFAASYISGYLFLLLPGGIGVREGVMVLLLKGTVGEGPAVGLAAASRVVLTINEIGAALPFLFLHRRRRVRPQPSPSRQAERVSSSGDPA